MKSKMPSFKIITKFKRRLFSRPWLVWGLTVIFLILLTAIASYHLIWQPFLSHYSFLQLQTQAANFLNPASTLAQTQNRTNILIMGKGGAGHDTPDLTDSIILISINHQTRYIHLLSLPRDIWIPSLRAKLNTAYHYGQQLQTNGGLIMAKSAVSEITNLPVHYGLVIDFTGFEKIIDLLGGIDVPIDRTFDDYKYPVPGMENAENIADRYQHIRFEAGLQHLNGKTALQYVRSRNAQGIEGTDLARSERQKKVLLAVKDKLLSTQVIFNRSKLFQLKNILGQSLTTDISDERYPAFVRLALNFRTENLYSNNLPVYLNTENGNSASESALLINPPISTHYDNQWVLVPKSGSFTQIHNFISCSLKNQNNCL
jgi:LCP family protein required for cell wall assembly